MTNLLKRKAMTNLLKRKLEVLDAQPLRVSKRMRFTTNSTDIKSFPEDLLIEILAKVASSSFTDVFSAKLVTKDFLQASEDGKIFQHVSLQNFPKVLWKTSPKLWSFMENCTNYGNPEALYRKGMLDFFTWCKQASGLANLKASAQQGHAEASYVYGVVLYSSSESLLKEEGLKFLKICHAKSGAKIVECRRRVKSFVGDIWINNDIFSSKKENFRGQKSCDCVIKNNCKNYNYERWNWTDEKDNYGEHKCETCKWNEEVFKFCNMLRTGRYN